MKLISPKENFILHYTAVINPTCGKPYAVPSWQFPRLFPKDEFFEIVTLVKSENPDLIVRRLPSGAIVEFKKIKHAN